MFCLGKGNCSEVTPVNINDNCWIGARVIFSGMEIGKRCVVGKMNSH
ncbi:DapH/DapD/GlmU-related protein [Peribacillus frigoritolerans]